MAKLIKVAIIGCGGIANAKHKETYIVLDTNTNLAETLYDRISMSERHKKLFISKEQAMMNVDLKTLLVVVDTHRGNYTEMPELLKYAGKIAVIDHHRKTAEFKIQPKISYIEPSASSASELLCEFLEQIIPLKTLPKIEADFLLAGIFLDTKNFTHNTGIRTFSSAMYLRGEGANPIDAKSLFNMELDDFRSEASFETNIGNCHGTDHRSIGIATFPCFLQFDSNHPMGNGHSN